MNKRHGVKPVYARNGDGKRRAAALLLAGALAGCAGAGGKPDFEFTGTVYDAVTKQPIEGAYVFASDREEVGVNSRCYKSRGMYTGKDGKYHFPIEKLDGNHPWLTSAIKPGYYFGRFDVPKPEVWKRQDASSYADRNIYLIPQDPAKPSVRIGSGEEVCMGARTREDAAAAALFLRMQLDEFIKYRIEQDKVESLKYLMTVLESLPPSTSDQASQSKRTK